MPEILLRIKEEMGPDAVILSTRKVKKDSGSFGMFTRQIIEVTAAVDIDEYADEPAPPARNPYRQEPPRRDRERERNEEEARVKSHGMFLSLQAEIDNLREELSSLGRPAPVRQPVVESTAVAATLKNLESKIDRLVEQKASADSLGLSPALKLLRNDLHDRDLDPSLSSRIFSYLQEKVDQGAIRPGEEDRALRELVSRTVKVATPPEFDTRQVWAFVGPTGVGKTTTVAKLAARYALQGGKKVGLITVDTFRIAAVEQLRTYANIMDVPIRVALGQGDFRSAVKEFSDRDLILVDTAGQSPKDEEALGQLLSIFPKEVETHIHLVLSVTTRGRDLEKILKHYAPVGVRKLVLTKIDETDCHGPLLTLPVVSRLPLSYLTMGQNVPDDIEPATAERVVSLIVGEAGAQR